MTSKTIHTLPKDIYGLFEQPHTVDSKNLDEFRENVGNVVREALESAGKPSDFVLRMSNIGSPARKLWYDSRDANYGVLDGKTYFKFLYGHVLEALILFLAKEAGHEVTDEQKEVELDGIKGHMDARIDGVITDAKSASPYGFNKFISGSILTDDSFGYCHQLRGYFEADSGEDLSEELAWLVLNKVNGDIGVVSYSAYELPSAKDKIEELKKVLDKDTPPELCYEETEDKMGNKVLPKLCSWCQHKNKCWDYRTFMYSTGPVYLTEVNKKPRVPEITK